MKTPLLSLALGLPLLGQADLHCTGDPLPSFIGNPALVSGQGTCFHELINGSSRLRLTLGENSHLRWSQLSLLEGDLLEFQFVDGANAVLNQLDGSRSVLRGTISAPEGSLGMISPTGTLSFQDSSRIEAGSLLLSNHSLSDPAAFLNGQGYQLTAVDSARLTIRGDLLTSGDLIVASSGFLTASNATITGSSGSVVLAAGNKLNVDPSSPTLITNQSSNDSSISLNAPLRAGNSIQLDATNRILLGNALSTTTPQGKIYVRVDQDGLIESQVNPLPVIGKLTLSGPVSGDVTPINPNDGDNASSAVPSMSQLPTLHRGDRAAKYKSAPVHIRSGRKTSTSQAALPQKKATTSVTQGKIAMRSSSFFGLRSRSTK